jgi:hypothetical protein
MGLHRPPTPADVPPRAGWADRGAPCSGRVREARGGTPGARAWGYRSDGDLGPDPRRTRRLGVPRGATNGAPCLGLALAAGGALWGIIGAALAGLARLLA